MVSASENNKRIAKNTVILYCRMFLMLAIGLFTSRVILQTLGVEDYGVYNAVGGFVAMFGLLSGTLVMAINRFLTFELGKGDQQKLMRVFSTSLNVMFILSGVILLAGATLGVWFLNTQMNIPDGRMGAANIVLICSVLTFIINLISVPYNASIISHEKMSAFAYISLLEISAKLGIVYALYLTSADKLVMYAIMLLTLQLLVRFIYGVYCKRHFVECSYHFILDKPLLKEMLTFAGWTFIGGSAGLINNTGVNVLMNVFFGVTVNAARGIAVQVNGHVQQFVTNFLMAVNPQITKSYAQGDYAYMHSLVCRGAKFSYFLMFIFLVPISLEANQLLKIWLGQVPDYAVIFVQLALVMTTMNSVTITLITAIHATGNLKRFQIITGIVETMNFPLTYIVFLLGAPPQSAYYVYFVVYFILMILRLYLVKDLIHMKASYFIKKVYVKIVLVSALAIVVPIVLRLLIAEETFLRFLVVCTASFISSFSIIYLVGLDVGERQLVIKLIKKRVLHSA